MQIEWLETLEERVREATARLRDLQEENRKLQRRVGELEERLAEGEGAASGWDEERDEIRRRVEGLVRTLEDLLEE